MRTNSTRVPRFCRMAIVLLSGAGHCFAGTLVGPGQDDFDREVGSVSQEGLTLNYEFFRPPGYDTSGDLPLVVFLHGYSDGQTSKQSRLNDTMLGLVQATQKENTQRFGRNCRIHSCSEADEAYASFLLVPKIPVVEGWYFYTEMVRDMIDDFGQRYSVDPRRIYLTGYSNGGFATVSMPELYPGLFAAGAPISGGGYPYAETVEALRDLPIWFFHGSSDGAVDPSYSVDLYDALIAAGHNDAHLSLVSGGHDAGFEAAYPDSDNTFYPWLFSKTLPVPEPGGVALAALALGSLVARRRPTG